MIDQKELGGYVGKDLWIVDYRQPDLYKKPIRALTPTLARVALASDFKKKIYYSDFCFLKMGKNGPTSQVIQIYDNTGFRARTGTNIKIFESEERCRGYFKLQISEITKKIDMEIEGVLDRLEGMKADLLGLT